MDTPGTDYAGNFGSGVQAYGYNGIIRPLNGVAGVDPDPSAVYTVAPTVVTDGLSNTAATADILIAVDGQEDAMRAIWQTPSTLPLPSELDAFAGECESMASPFLYVPLRGVSWLFKDQSFTGYNHVLPPNNKSCTNGHTVPLGAYTASSLHVNGVNVLRADGHAGFVYESVDRAVWRALGSRCNGEALYY